LDESVLTGETVPVTKTSQALPGGAQDIFTAANIGFAGTTVVQGKAWGVVIAIGKQSSLGNITALSWQTNRVSSFSKIVSRFSRFILILMLISLLLIFGLHLLVKQHNVD